MSRVSVTRLLVLGVLRKREQAHGYSVRQELLSWRADLWAKIAPGSVYQALRTLTKHGLLDQVATEAGGAGPERTVYRITPDGEQEFLIVLRAAVTDPGTSTETINAAFAFLHELPRDEVIGLFGYRMRSLRSRLGPDCLVGEELTLQGRLYGLDARHAADRAAELLVALDLAGTGRRVVSSLSGGQRRRLDIAMGLMHVPDLLFTDEPTRPRPAEPREPLAAHPRPAR